jgi:hypothetical protein
MNELQEKSLKLIEEFFKNMDGIEFLKEHESLEKNIGPTLDIFLDSFQNSSYSSFIKMESESMSKLNELVEIEERSYSSFNGKKNGCYAANDENYPMRLAA